MREGISVCMIIYNDGEIVRRALESVKDIADEILIVHDGPCNNNTLDICREYTKNIFIRPHRGMCEYHQAYLYRKAKYDWILKLDSDEYLTAPLQKNIRKLIKNEEVEMYNFIEPIWDEENKRYVTKNWPLKGVLYRKDKISYLGFANWGQPTVKGAIVNSKYRLEHRSPKGLGLSWKKYRDRNIKLVAYSQAKDSLKDFKELDSFNYPLEDFPFQIKIRIKYPLLSAIPMGLCSMVLSLRGEGWREAPKINFKMLFLNFINYLALGYYIYKLKKNPNFSPK